MLGLTSIGDILVNSDSGREKVESGPRVAKRISALIKFMYN